MNDLSPKPVKKEITNTMDFPAAIRKATEGFKIARIEWHNTDYGLLKNSFLTIYRNGEFFRWSVNDGDLLAKDWIIVSDKN